MSKEDKKGQVFAGKVVRRSGDKTVLVEVVTVTRHYKYGKKVVRSRRFLAHDKDNSVKVGQLVTIAGSRPLSRRKRWAVVGIEKSGE